MREEDVEGESNKDVEIVDLDDTQTERPNANGQVTAPRFSLPQRRAQLLSTIIVFILAFCLVLGTYAPTRTVLVHTVLPSSLKPTATIPPGTDFVYVQANPPWGQLRVDGRPIAHLPIAGVDEPLHLARGIHSLFWSAPPFPAQKCVMSVPPDYLRDTCYSDEIVTAPHGSARLLRFLASLGMLPDTLSRSLVETVETTLNMQGTTALVPPGASYAATIGPMGVAQQPLRAGLHFQLDTNIHSGENCSSYFGPNDGCIYNRQDCRTFCSAGDLFSPAIVRSNAWLILAAVHVLWNYTTLTGTPIAMNQPDIVNGNANDHFLPLGITWDGTHWHTQIYSKTLRPDMQAMFNPVCNDAQEYLTIEPWLSYVVADQAGTNWTYVADSNWSDGCLAVVKLDAGTIITPIAHVPVAWCLHRFGVLVAANATAHMFWPDMPLATPDEIHIAQQLAQLQQ